MLGGLLAAVGLARGVLGQRADRDRRRRLVVPVAASSSASATQARLDWWGNVTFAVGLSAWCSRAITYGIEPYGGHPMGWTNPWVIGGIVGGIALLVAFCVIETQGDRPDVRDERCSGSGRSAPATWPGLLAAIGRGGMQFMLIIWLQGIWLPLHGYSLRADAAVGRAST